ncbi:MAG TPA: proline dehydrogenase family protein [Nonomuraea sp.]|nr:proline dehydrogenase family protein [Nonomuraea sp.]
MLRQALLAVSRSARAERVISASPLTRGVVKRYVADDIAHTVKELTRRGLLVTVDHLGGDVRDRAQAEGAVRAYLDVLRVLPEGSDVSVRLTALGLRLSEQLALDNAATICEAAAPRGLTVTLDAEEHDTIAGLHSIHGTLRKEHPSVGVVVQAGLPDAAERCAKLDGARVRLRKGALTVPGGHASPADVDRSYARCLRVLMAGTAYPMVATHDPRLLGIAATLAVLEGRDHNGFEYQMLYGVRPDEQERLAGQGARVRVYVPYGAGWYGYFMRRLAERPANLALFARSLLSRG